MSDQTDAQDCPPEDRARLERHRNRLLPFRVVAARPRFVIAAGAGALVGWLAPDAYAVVTRSLIGWNVATLTYLAIVLASTWAASHRRIRLQAQMLDDGRFLVLALTALAAVAAIGAIVAELAAAKDLHGLERTTHLALAGLTIVTSWLFIHMVFAMHYAHEFYLERGFSDSDLAGLEDDDDDDDAEDRDDAPDPRGGLIFPATSEPIYVDFIYFSYVIGVASQTADVSVSSRPMRRVSLAHSVLSFFFNTTILALTINLAAGLF